MNDKNTLEKISTNLVRLNRALGHKRGLSRVTLDTAATPEQRVLVLELAAWEDALQARLNLDSACAYARRLANGEYRLQESGTEPRYLIDDEGRRQVLEGGTGRRART